MKSIDFVGNDQKAISRERAQAIKDLELAKSELQNELFTDLPTGVMVPAFTKYYDAWCRRFEWEVTTPTEVYFSALRAANYALFDLRFARKHRDITDFIYTQLKLERVYLRFCIIRCKK